MKAKVKTVPVVNPTHGIYVITKRRNGELGSIGEIVDMYNGFAYIYSINEKAEYMNLYIDDKMYHYQKPLDELYTLVVEYNYMQTPLTYSFNNWQTVIDYNVIDRDELIDIEIIDNSKWYKNSERMYAFIKILPKPKVKHIDLKRAQVLEENIGWLSDYSGSEEFDLEVRINGKSSNEYTEILQQLGQLNKTRKELLQKLMEFHS